MALPIYKRLPHTLFITLKTIRLFQNYSSLVNKNLACRLQQISAVNGWFFTPLIEKSLKP